MESVRLFLFLAFLPAAPARADILFLDLNNSPKEIEAARASAKKRGEKLVVLPPPVATLTRQREQEKLKQAENLQNQMLEYCKADDPGPECTDLNEQVKATNEELYGRTSQFSVAMLEKELEAREASGEYFTSIVLSGHDGTGEFHGDNGRVTDFELAVAMEKFPKQKQAVRGLHLWGCYTTTIGSVVTNWKKHFPQISLLTGYDDRAPLNSTPAGWSYLRGVLDNENKLIAAGDAKKIQKILMQVPGVSNIGLSAAVVSCDIYANREDAFALADLPSRCGAYEKEVRAALPAYECYVRALDEKCADVPANTARSELRDFYRALHKGEACVDLEGFPYFKDIFSAYSRDQAIRLVFFKNVQKNVAKIHGEELRNLDAWLEKKGAPENLRFAQLDTLTRQQLVERMGDLLAFAQKTEKTRRGRLFRNHSALTKSLMNLGSECVPFSWTEPASAERSACFDKLSGKIPKLAMPLFDEERGGNPDEDEN